MTDHTQAMQAAIALEGQLRHASGPDAISAATAAIKSTQAELARLSGMTPNTISALKNGKQPSAAQRAALCWAVARYLAG